MVRKELLRLCVSPFLNLMFIFLSSLRFHLILGIGFPMAEQLSSMLLPSSPVALPLAGEFSMMTGGRITISLKSCKEVTS